MTGRTMACKYLFAITVFMWIISVNAAVFSAGKDCSTLLKRACLECHEKENYCNKIGESEAFWRATLTEMVDNGAEISDLEEKELFTCLTDSGDTLKKICQETE